MELPDQLIALPTASAPRASTGVAAAAAGTIPAATRFLGTRLIHLQGAAFNIHAVEFTDGFGGVVSRSQLHKTKTARAPGFAVSNDASRGHLISLCNEKLLQAFVRHAKRQIPNIEFCHTRFLFLPLSFVHKRPVASSDARTWLEEPRELSWVTRPMEKFRGKHRSGRPESSLDRTSRMRYFTNLVKYLKFV